MSDNDNRTDNRNAGRQALVDDWLRPLAVEWLGPEGAARLAAAEQRALEKRLADQEEKKE